MKKLLRKTVDALIDKSWFLSIVNWVYNHLSSKKKAFFLRNIRKPNADYLWRIKLLNGKKVNSQTYANDNPMSQLSWDFVFSYHWYDPAMCVLENEINKHMDKEALWIDIGANMGLRSLVPLSSGRQVHMFEPNPLLVKIIEERNQLNGFNNYSLINAGVSSKKGELDFFLSKSTYTSSFDKSQVPEGELDDVKKVPVISLDEYFQDWQSETDAFVKIDVEGYELEVLKGASRLLKSTGCIFLIEVNRFENLLKLIEIMNAYNYSAFELDSYNEKKPLSVLDIKEMQKSGELKNNNFFFIRDAHKIMSSLHMIIKENGHKQA